MKQICVTILFFWITSLITLAQYDTIPQEQVPIQVERYSNKNLQDSIFWANIGFLTFQKYKFAAISDYRILVNTKGTYFKLDLVDSNNRLVISSVHFIPHKRISDAKYAEEDFVWVPNEHLCLCSAKTGSATVEIVNGEFTCKPASPEYDTPENVTTDCHDTQHIIIFFQKYYALGLEQKQYLKVIPPQIIK